MRDAEEANPGVIDRAIIAGKLANMAKGNPNFKSANLPNSEGPVSNAGAADTLNVWERSVKSARKVLEQAPDLADVGRAPPRLWFHSPISGAVD